MRFNSKIKLLIVLILIIAFFLLLNLTVFGQKIRNFFYQISAPIQKFFWRTGQAISAFFGAISDFKNLKKENTELNLRVLELLAENISLKELEEENQMLREALNLGLEKEFQLILAEVVGKDIYQDSLLINKGSKDGVVEGLPVISEQKILVGKINQVYEDFSRVILISNPESNFDGEIVDSGVLGVVQGKGNLKVSFNLIPKEKTVEKGDLVKTIALAKIFPPGLLVGQISKVVKTDLEPFQEAEIQPAFNLQLLEKLFIITKW